LLNLGDAEEVLALFERHLRWQNAKPYHGYSEDFDELRTSLQGASGEIGWRLIAIGGPEPAGR
jgi:hypothetical protein